jgi:hypothetical protein
MCRECRSGKPPREEKEAVVVERRECEVCGAELGPKTKAAKCQRCRRTEHRKKNTKRCECGNRLGANNKSGRCLRCFLKTKAHQKRRDEFWEQTNVGLQTGEQSYWRNS